MPVSVQMKLEVLRTICDLQYRGVGGLPPRQSVIRPPMRGGLRQMKVTSSTNLGSNLGGRAQEISGQASIATFIAISSNLAAFLARM
jgi:hypothetical protein